VEAGHGGRLKTQDCKIQEQEELERGAWALFLRLASSGLVSSLQIEKPFGFFKEAFLHRPRAHTGFERRSPCFSMLLPRWRQRSAEALTQALAEYAATGIPRALTGFQAPESMLQHASAEVEIKIG
jgi:hypothetical protein